MEAMRKSSVKAKRASLDDFTIESHEVEADHVLVKVSCPIGKGNRDAAQSAAHEFVRKNVSKDAALDPFDRIPVRDTKTMTKYEVKIAL